MKKLFVTQKEVIECLQMSETTIWRERKKGKFPQPRRKGTPLLWHVDDIEAYAENPDGWVQEIN